MTEENRVIQRIGDVNPLLYGGGVVLKTESGYSLEYTKGLEDLFEGDGFKAERAEYDPDQELEVFSCDIEDNVFDYHKWASAEEIADQFTDYDEHDIIVMGRSENLEDRVFCTQEIGELWGWNNLDNYPTKFSIADLIGRWELSNG